MKKIFSIVSIALTLLTLSCRKASQMPAQYQIPEPLQYEGPGAVEFECAGGSNQLIVPGAIAVEAVSSAAWLEVTTSGRFVYLSAPENNTLLTRYATLSLSAGGKTRSIQVKQYGVTNEYLWEEEYQFPYTGGSIHLRYQPTTATVRVQVQGREWISVEMGEESLDIIVAKNAEDEEREGSVTWIAGEIERVIAIKQELNPGGGGGGGGGGEDPVGSVLFSEDFEDVSNLDEWLLYDRDGDDYNWDYNNTGFAAHSGSGILFSQSYDNNAGPLTPDNWVITPGIDLASSDNYLSFWVCPQDGAYPKEHYAVYVMTIDPTTSSDPLSDSVKILEGTLTSGYTTSSLQPFEAGSWEHPVVKIPDDFNGKTVYIAFRHFDCTDWFYINLDDVLVTKGDPASMSVTYAPSAIPESTIPNAKRK